jgi:hypothetical protein
MGEHQIIEWTATVLLAVGGIRLITGDILRLIDDLKKRR